MRFCTNSFNILPYIYNPKTDLIMEKDKTIKVKQGNTHPDMGNFIHYHIQQNKIKKADLARALNVAPTSLNDYFKKPSLSFTTLWNLSLAMNHNFVSQLGEYFPVPFETIREKALKEQLAEKEAIIQKMEIQLETFREMMKKS